MASSNNHIVLCFDGTGNKFSGTEGDSNVMKIYKMLDREADDVLTYYQPGICTYSTSAKLNHSGRVERIKSWYEKAKDSAIGTNFAYHVVGGYRFLMSHYKAGDDIFIFGFSRGAYTARFLAEMLDCVGLLSSGNEEMIRFAWKAFYKWQTRTEDSAAEKKLKDEHFRYMKAFRETFSIPVKRIRFLGLFDTVNSVPQFEANWMQRAKFPYTAKTSAKVIRHAVSIDERRAKFRQDLISQKRPKDKGHHHHHHPHIPHPHLLEKDHETNGRGDQQGSQAKRDPVYLSDRFQSRRQHPNRQSLAVPNQPGEGSRPDSRTQSRTSIASHEMAAEHQEDDEDKGEQDIQEVWFPGCHADIGGGWGLEEAKGEKTAISHIPLMWIIREARKAGLRFDEDSLREANYILEEEVQATSRAAIPNINIVQEGAVTPGLDNFHDAPENQRDFGGAAGRSNPALPVINQDGTVVSQSAQDGPLTSASKTYNPRRADFLERQKAGSTQGVIHDVLQRDNGLPTSSVLSWNIMEYLPFRRMDLRPDGSWKPIRWPLPRGETRDIPAEAWIHHSAIRRMEADEKYRPGNLIVGGGGRGMRTAPKDVGMGKWNVSREPGDPIGEVFVRATEAGNMEELKQ